MAPQPYVDTYKTYEEGTKGITTWLVENVRRCGADLSFLDSVVSTTANSGDAAKSKKGKTAPAKSIKYQVPLKQFTTVAKRIASSTDPKIELPRSISRLFQSVVILRKQVSDFFTKITKSKSSAAAQAADAGHRHFISVLEDVLNILRPAKPTDETDAAPLVNQFEALTVEGPTSPGGSSPPTAGKKAAKRAELTEYDIESSAAVENIFAIFAFFKDVNEVRQYLQTVGTDYRGGKLDIMSAAVTTDTAFTLLKHSSEEVQQTIPGHPNHSGMIDFLRSYLEKQGGTTDTFGDWTCLKTTNLLNSYEDLLDSSTVPVLK